MLSIYKRLVSDPQDAWNHIAALNPPPFSAVHPFCTLGLLLAPLGPGIRFAIRQGFRMGLGQFLLHLLVHTLAYVVLFYSIRREGARLRNSSSDSLSAGQSVITAGALAAPVWAFSVLLFMPVPCSDWLLLLLGIGMSVYYYTFASASVLAVPDAEVSKSRIRVVAPFAATVLIGHLICNWIAGSPIYVR